MSDPDRGWSWRERTHCGIAAATTLALLAGAFALTAGLALAQRPLDPEADRLKAYRDMLAADPWANPALLDADHGEELWKAKRGPRNVSLEACDLGKGPGVVAGAFAELPRYFADAGRVMDIEARLMWCMVSVQGFDRAKLLAEPFPTPGRPTSELAALATWIAAKSAGLPLSPHVLAPEERRVYRLGEALYWRRQGPMDFACASCHSSDGKRIRMQELAHLTKPSDARTALAGWPAYRVSLSSTTTLEQRLADCYWQMRLPEFEPGSTVPVALTLYLASRAAGARLAAPGLKR